MRPEAWAFGASMALASAGTVIALSGLAAVQQTCSSTGDAGPQTHTLVQVPCSYFLSYFWVTVGLQIVFLLGVAAALAACKVHTFRPTLYAVGGVCVALGAQQSWAAYRLMQDLPQGSLYNRWAAFIAGAATYTAGTILLSFTGDAMYRALRVERRDGFVTFRRLPSTWERKLEEQHSEPPEEEGQAPALPGHAGLLRWGFLAALALALAGACIALGGTASLQAYCADNGFVQTFFGRRVANCDPYLSLWWLAWAFQVAFLAVLGWAYRAKQVHSFRNSLWSTAAIATALACFGNFGLYLFVNMTTGQMRSRYQATLAGFCCSAAGNFLLMMLGDAMYRLKHAEGADGFVSFLRPGPYAPKAAAAAGATRRWRPIDVAFAASLGVACAGTCIALGGVAGAQASCNVEEAGPRWGSLCQVFSYFWWVVALHMFVLAATAAAWATRNVINFRASLWGLLTVAIHGATVAAWNANCFRQGPAQGAHEESVTVLLYGLAIAMAGDFLFMATGDALYQMRREEGEQGFVTFRIRA